MNWLSIYTNLRNAFRALDTDSKSCSNPRETPNARAIQRVIQGLAGVKVSRQERDLAIEFLGTCDHQTIEQLLRTLSLNNVQFALYDDCYPSPSDPGAYFSYSPDGRDPSVWHMTLGNHGWTGGIYRISQHSVCAQIVHLVALGRLKAITVEHVSFFSHYPMMDLSKNQEMDGRLAALHASSG